MRFGEVPEGEKRAQINPLDKTIKLTHQRDVISGIIVSAIGEIEGRKITKLSPEERSLLIEGIRASHARFGTGDNGLTTGVAVTPVLVEMLGNPTVEMAVAMNPAINEVKDPARRQHVIENERDRLRNVGKSMFHALKDRVENDLAGIIDQETNFNHFQDTPLLVMCCAGMDREVAVQMALLIEFFGRSQYAIENPRFRIHHRVDDEFWDLARNPIYVESARDDFKQSGKGGRSRKVITHHLQNLKRSGSPAVGDLVSDSDIKIFYKMDPNELADSADELELNEAEIKIITNLPAGRCMYKFRDRPGIVVTRKARERERRFVETRGLYFGRDRMTDAEPVASRQR
jgi:hypothetical protein